jgi:hypothetical protein
MSYTAPAQAFSLELSTPRPPHQMRAEEHVLALRSKDKNERANALEWLDRPIDKIAPKVNAMPLSSTIECSNCCKEKPRNAFRDHPKKVNGKQSQCRACENRRRVIRYHNGKSVRYSEIVVKSGDK